MKKLLSVVLALATLVVCFAACSCSNEKTLTVGICNYVDDASLNQIVENIQTEINRIATEKNTKVVIKYQNCNADATLLNQIIQNFIADKVDVMVAVATPVAMAMQSATEDNKIPVVFAAVSDPVSTGIVESLDKPGANLTGTSDYLDTNAVMNLMFAVKPGISKVGLLYDAGQDSSTTAIAAAKTFLASKGVTVVEKTGTNTSEVGLAVDALISEKVEAIFTPTDNTIMTAELSVYEKLQNAKIPHYAGANSFALNGAFIGYGVDYANLGVETGKMVCEILFDKKAPADMPVKTFDNGTATVNTETCSKVGLELEAVKTAITPFCNKIETLVTAETFN